jgi:hypothetical protein
MNTVVIVELKRFGWSQKIIKKSFVIIGRSPYAETLKLHGVWKKVLPYEKGKKPLAEEAWLSQNALDSVQCPLKQAMSRDGLRSSRVNRAPF